MFLMWWVGFKKRALISEEKNKNSPNAVHLLSSLHNCGKAPVQFINADGESDAYDVGVYFSRICSDHVNG